LVESCQGALVRTKSDFTQTDLTELTGESGVPLGLRTHNVHELQPGATINPEVVQILTKESETFAKEKDCNESEDNNRNECVASKECFDRYFRA
jgi:hypothetical protein